MNLHGAEDKAWYQPLALFTFLSHWVPLEGAQCYLLSYISGKTKMQERSDIIKQFNTEREPSVLCVSLQVGGEGLNLQAANQVFLMDPWWNPAAEQQAMHRCHRSLRV